MTSLSRQVSGLDTKKETSCVTIGETGIDYVKTLVVILTTFVLSPYIEKRVSVIRIPIRTHMCLLNARSPQSFPVHLNQFTIYKQCFTLFLIDRADVVC